MYYIVLFFLNAQIFFAQQNIVPNSSFEDTIYCPGGISDFSPTNWLTPTWGSSDYFHECNQLDVGVPNNFVGFQHPKEGFAFSGFASGFGNSNIREYIQVELLEPLVKNQDYLFSCFVSLAELSGVSIKKIGVAFTSNQIGGSYSSNILFSPQIENTSHFLNDTVDWVEISDIYTADGNEKFITIGCFGNDLEIEQQLLNNNVDDPVAYYYIDEVSLVKQSIEIPNVFTPNNDGINDFWTIPYLKNIELFIVNRWGNKIFEHKKNEQNPQWNGTDKNGFDCEEGIYFYKIVKTNKTYTGFIQLVR